MQADSLLLAGSGPKLAFPKADLLAILRHYLERLLWPNNRHSIPSRSMR